MKNPITLLLLLMLPAWFQVHAQKLDQYRYTGSPGVPENSISEKIRFNGYTDYWHDSYHEWYRYGNLFKIEVPDVRLTIAQNKVNMAAELGIPGLAMQEGFISGLLGAPFTRLKEPSVREIENGIKEGNLLVYTTPGSPAGEKLLTLAGSVNPWKKELSSHQYEASDYYLVDAFYLENGSSRIFTVISSQKEDLEIFDNLLENTKRIVSDFDLHRGWMGVETTYKSVGINFGHPLEIIGKGMNEGNSWFIFSGYNDFIAKDEISGWMEEVGKPVYADVGSTTLSYISGTSCFHFGCEDYIGLQEQDITLTDYLNFIREKNGMVFRQVYDSVADPHLFDGFVATEGNKELIDREGVPFVHRTGNLKDGVAAFMVLFLKKGIPLDRKSLMSAIEDRKAVAVLPAGEMMGPGLFRNTLQMLLLDRVYLEEYFMDQVSIKALVDGYDLQIVVKNLDQHTITGDLEIILPPGLETDKKDLQGISLPAGSEKFLHFTIRVSKDAMGNTKPIAVNFEWDGKKKSTITKIDLPPAISVHRLLYGQAPVVSYPVSLHNYTAMPSFPLKVSVSEKNDPDRIVYEAERISNISPGAYQEVIFDLDVQAGDYEVTVSALDSEATTQLGVEDPEGDPEVYKIDLNNDGVSEYRMENDSVMVTLLATGARVIEYIVKSKDDNVFFKLWPDKPVDDRSAFRKRRFFPYGGFEDFLGGASMESHKVYDAEIIKNGEGSVSVRMRAEFFGNMLEKIFTLYGNSPLLEVKYTLDFKYPEASIIGPQPILTLGEEHGLEDVFIIPDMDGIQEYRMNKEVYYGRMFNMKEGWNAGYDTRESISFVGAFPVDQPEFMHMYMNHTLNPASHYNYVEFQPWIHITRKNKMYFSYYMWASAGRWEHGLKELRNRNLISQTKK
jgi:hypothetical protein